MLQIVADCCRLLQFVADCCSLLQIVADCCRLLQFVAVCCSLLQIVADCCRLLQIVADCCRLLQIVAVCCSLLQFVAVCCSLLQFVAVCCSLLQFVIVCDSCFCPVGFAIRRSILSCMISNPPPCRCRSSASGSKASRTTLYCRHADSAAADEKYFCAPVELESSSGCPALHPDGFAICPRLAAAIAPRGRGKSARRQFRPLGKPIC